MIELIVVIRLISKILAEKLRLMAKIGEKAKMIPKINRIIVFFFGFDFILISLK
ncbi:MAG: hypothetical protein ACFE9V_17320 [Candidatus Hodarchaeota archaeon]